MEVLIKIAKASNDTAETKFCGFNGRNYSLEVGKEIWIPADLYYNVLIKGSLKDRVQRLNER